MPVFRHKPGNLRQVNKKNKRYKSSKRSLSRSQGGRVNASVKQQASQIASQSKANRRNHQNQIRQSKKQAALAKRRGGGSVDSKSSTTTITPRIVGIISLGNSTEIEEQVRQFILQGADKVINNNDKNNSSITCKFDVHKKDGVLTLLTASTAFAHYQSTPTKDCDEQDIDSAVMAALDMARIADCILCVMDGDATKDIVSEIHIGGDDNATQSTSKTNQDWDHLISERGDRILAAIKGQGLPTPITVLAQTNAENNDDDDDDDMMTMQSMKSLRRSKIKKHLDLKKYVTRFALTEFGNDNNKVLEIILKANQIEQIQQSSAQLVRTLCSMSCSPAKWVAQSPRAYIVSDNVRYSENEKELYLTGYVRGMAPFDVNSLIHIPNVGTYACKSVQKAVNPLKRQTQTMDEDAIVMSNPEIRESLNMFATPDALEGEQNLIGFDEDDQPIDDNDEKTNKEERPVGWSDYQSAWLDAVDEDVIDGKDHGELAEELNKKSGSVSLANTDGMDLDDDANEVSASERKALIEERKKQQTDELEFPDEVQIGEDDKARERFARYRSLKSFRKSYWDPKESLPESYASIFHFLSFKQTQRSVMNDMKELIHEAEAVNGNFFGKSPVNKSDYMADDSDEEEDFLEGCVPSGSYVTVTIEKVAKEDFKNISEKALLAAVSLLPHENKISVLHMGLSQSSGCDHTDEKYPIKSKDVLTFRCGWRTWKARPVFSQNNLNCDKHKFERFLPTGGAFFAASIFGPVTYSPCPVLVFRENGGSTVGDGASTRRELVAIGSMLGADADRIVIKRIILTGYPVRVHKRHATVKYMFYDPEDVKWFKPAGLYTKHGLQGNIVQSVGEHGTMKCLFNAPIKQHDTVCLPLYKRIYPKYAPLHNNTNNEQSGSSIYREGSNIKVY